VWTWLLLKTIVRETRDATTEKLTGEYNRRIERARRVHRSSFCARCIRAGTF